MELVEKLDDVAAINAIGTIARDISVDETVSLDAPKQIATEWRNAIGQSDADHATASEGDLARATLSWLATDPSQRRAIEAFIATPSSQQNDTVTIGVILLVLLLLMEKRVVAFKDGRWRLKGVPTQRTDQRLKTVFDLLAKVSMG